MRTPYPLLVAALAGSLFACGQKGPLVLPDAQHPHKKIGIPKPPAPASPAQASPAPASPAQASPAPASPAQASPAPASPASAPNPAPAPAPPP
ncbi:MAG: lipoprotein [Steroidobacteraceae bacterium]